MKLQYLAVLVSSIAMAGPASATEIYNKNGNKLNLSGKLTGMNYLSSDSNKNGDHSSIQYELQGTTQINDQLTGFGMWEHEIAIHHTENEKNKDNLTHIGFAGIKIGDYSSIDYGRNYGVLYDVGSWTNVMPVFSGDTTVSDNFLSGRASNVLTYRNTNFFGMVDGLNFALQYQGKNDNNGNKNYHVQEVNGEGYGLSISYDFSNDVSAAASYTNSNRLDSQRSLVIMNQDKKAAAYSVGLKYDDDNLYLAALYSETKKMTPFGNFKDNITNDNTYGFADKAKNIELVAQYQFDFGLRPSIGYLQSRIDEDSNGKNQDIKKYIEVGSSYNFNKNMLTFIDYRINLLSNDNFTRNAHISTNNIFALGMTYIF